MISLRQLGLAIVATTFASVVNDTVSAADNHVLTLSAVGDYMTAPHTASLAAGGELTVEYWVLFKNVSGFGRVGKQAPSDCQWDFSPRVGTNETGFLQCGMATDVDNADKFTVPQNQWVHLAATWKQSTGIAKVYINGQLVRSVTGTTSATNAATYPVLIGMQPGYSNTQLFGSVDNFRIWSVERTAQQIADLRFTEIAAGQTGNYPGLVASWTFENGAADSTGVNNGTLMGGATITVDNNWRPPASPNHVLKLSAVGDYMTAPHTASLAAAGELTVEYWLLFKNTSGFGRVAKRDPSACQWSVGTGVGTGASGFDICGVVGLQFTSPQNRWVHVAATWKRSTGLAIVYLDGQPVVSSTTATNAMSATTHPLLVGLQPGYSNSQLFGSVDNLRIWNVARSQQQIADLRFTEIQSGQSGAYPGLVASYTFENGAADSAGANNGTLMGAATIVEDGTFLPGGCIGDIIVDGKVDGVDLAAVLAQWGQGPSGPYNSDLNHDGVVTGADLAIMLSTWGACSQ